MKRAAAFILLVFAAACGPDAPLCPSDATPNGTACQCPGAVCVRRFASSSGTTLQCFCHPIGTVNNPILEIPDSMSCDTGMTLWKGQCPGAMTP